MRKIGFLTVVSAALVLMSQNVGAQCCGTYLAGSGDPLNGMRCASAAEQLAAAPDKAPGIADDPGIVAGCVDDNRGNCAGGSLLQENGTGLPMGPSGCNCVAGVCNHDSDPDPDEGGQLCTNEAVRICAAHDAAVVATPPQPPQGTAGLSPCCAAFDHDYNPSTPKRACNRLGVDLGPPGCAESADGAHCVGGGVVDSTDPQQQSPIGGCMCLTVPAGLGCNTDGSVGRWLTGQQPDPSANTTDPQNFRDICARDAVIGCEAIGAWHEVP